MKLTIHRGTHEIGGTCIELKSGDHRLILDLGMPLVDKNNQTFKLDKDKHNTEELVSEGILPRIDGLYSDKHNGKISLIISHAHQDHYGFSNLIDPGIPVYMTVGTKSVIEASAIFIRDISLPHNCVTLPKGKPIQIGPFKVLARLVDHSAADAVALEIEAEGKRIFYSGDIRGTGRKKKLFHILVKSPPKSIDLLLLEGTMIDRDKQQYHTEDDVEEALIKILTHKTNLGIFVASGQNIDRLVSAFRAVRITKSIFVLDLYTAFILFKLRTISEKLPQFYSNEIRIVYWQNHKNSLIKAGHGGFVQKVRSELITLDEISQNRKKILMLARSNRYFEEIMESLPNYEGLELIWSIWRGYQKNDKYIVPFSKKHEIQLKEIHTSGHAVIPDLIKLVEAIKPKKIIPIHTFKPERFPDFFDNVVLAEDGEVIDI